MISKYWLLIALILCSTVYTNAQTIFGTVENDEGEKLFGATIQWENTEIGTIADENGNFKLPKQEHLKNILVSYVGYNAVLIPVEPHEDTLLVVINGIYDLMEVEVAAKVWDNHFSTLSTLNVESISSEELRKAPCCNLAESFETNAAIDVTYNDAITGAREIQLLGLRGTYTQMLVENRPSLTGLGSAFAMEYIPGTWLKSIQISKGASSVQNGYQAITGQLNTELVKPFEDERLFVNLYGSTFGRGELNVHFNQQLTDKWSAGLLMHGSTRHNKLDFNEDGFYDTPQKDMLDGMFRLFYRGDDLRAQFNVHALTDEHIGGQIIPDNASNPNDYYKIWQKNERIEFFGKMGYLGFKELYNTLGFITNASVHQLNSLYHDTQHQGIQKNAYANLNYSTIIGTTDHKLNLGASFVFDEYEEMLDDSDYSRTERVPGVFVEYSFDINELEEDHENEGGHSHFLENLGIVAGLRIDHHNLYGLLVTPRLNTKFNFSDNSILRFSVGRGFRTANVIAENISILASSRAVDVTEELDMEDAWNIGTNFTQKFNLFGRESSLALDLYRTQFVNQIVMDVEQDAQKVLFYNLNGESYSNSFLAVWSYELLKGLDMKVAYKLNDVKITYLEGLQEKPMVARQRGLFTLDYKSPDENWKFNTALQLIGKQRFPKNSHLPEELAKDHTGYSPAYAKLGAQITRRFGKLEIYAGGENLTNYIQQNAIIDWENPFGEYFDATQIYAPITGAMGFVGLRYSFGKKEE